MSNKADRWFFILGFVRSHGAAVARRTAVLGQMLGAAAFWAVCLLGLTEAQGSVIVDSIQEHVAASEIDNGETLYSAGYTNTSIPPLGADTGGVGAGASRAQIVDSYYNGGAGPDLPVPGFTFGTVLSSWPDNAGNPVGLARISVTSASASVGSVLEFTLDATQAFVLNDWADGSSTFAVLTGPAGTWNPSAEGYTPGASNPVSYSASGFLTPGTYTISASASSSAPESNNQTSFYIGITAAVPEPVGLGLLAIGGLALPRRRR